MKEKKETSKLPDNSDNPYYGLRRVRLTEAMQESARVSVTDGLGKVFKAYKGELRRRANFLWFISFNIEIAK